MPIQLIPDLRTPIARTVSLSESEVCQLNMLREEHYTAGRSLEQLAESRGLRLLWFPGLPHASAAVEGDNIWIRPIDELTDRISFAHELHHVLFAPDVVAFAELTPIEIGRMEARATLFGALFGVPSMPEFNTEDDVYRIFGPMNRDAAYHWINYYRKTKVEL